MLEMAFTIYTVKTLIGLAITGIIVILGMACAIRSVYENRAYLKWRSKQKRQWKKKNKAKESDKAQSE